MTPTMQPNTQMLLTTGRYAAWALGARAVHLHDLKHRASFGARGATAEFEEAGYGCATVSVDTPGYLISISATDIA